MGHYRQQRDWELARGYSDNQRILLRQLLEKTLATADEDNDEIVPTIYEIIQGAAIEIAVNYKP